MKKLSIAVLFGLFLGVLSVNAQNPTRTPTPREETARIIREQQKANEAFNRIQNANQVATRTSNPSQIQVFLHPKLKPLYRNPTKEELETLSPNSEEVNKYADFLRQPSTGLIKLAADLGCAKNTKVVVATADCLKYTMPGAGTSFSFRTKNYRIRRLADLTFTDNSFQSTGVLLHGIFVKIGDVPLEKVNLQTKGLDYLINFQPETDYEKARTIDRQLSEGIFSDGFQYRRGLYAVENTTYVLRSIAYNGKYFRAVEGIAYDEFAFDKRRDVIVAFRIVRKDSDGGVTILWKELLRQNSPKIKYRKRLDEKTFEKDNFVAKKLLTNEFRK
jgi:hypothetical protein